jgi:hypothetical protein
MALMNVVLHPMIANTIKDMFKPGSDPISYIIPQIRVRKTDMIASTVVLFIFIPHSMMINYFTLTLRHVCDDLIQVNWSILMSDLFAVNAYVNRLAERWQSAMAMSVE